MTIWKYELIGSELEIEVPSYCQKKPLKIRYIQQQDKLEIWFIVDPESILEKRKFRIIGTGHSVPKNAEYIDTFFDGGYVWHLFEEYFYNDN